MNCDAATELIEPLAAGEIERSHELGAHLDACPRCAAELAVARLINRSLVAGGAQAPRHLTASVLRRLPPRTPDVRDGLEAWLETAAVLSLLPVIVGIWFLADPAALRHMTDAIGSTVSGISSRLYYSSAILITYLAIAMAGLLTVIGLGLVEEV